MEGSLSKELQPPRFSIKRWTKPWYVSDIPRIKNGCFDHPVVRFSRESSIGGYAVYLSCLQGSTGTVELRCSIKNSSDFSIWGPWKSSCFLDCCNPAGLSARKGLRCWRIASPRAWGGFAPDLVTREAAKKVQLSLRSRSSKVPTKTRRKAIPAMASRTFLRLQWKWMKTGSLEFPKIYPKSHEAKTASSPPGGSHLGWDLIETFCYKSSVMGYPNSLQAGWYPQC